MAINFRHAHTATHKSKRLPKVSGGKGGFWRRKFSFLKPAVGSVSMLMRALLCRVTYRVA